jgi:hypothetical protein
LGKTYWMLVTTQENLDITRERGFSIQGVDTKNRRKAVRMGPEDRILYYVSDKKGFAATATVTSESFEDEEPIWKHHRESESFPHRVEIEADVVLDPGTLVDAFQIGPTMEYVKKWPPDRWTLAFFGMLHIIPQRDFNFVENELKRIDGSLEAPEREPIETVVVVAVAEPTATEEPSSDDAVAEEETFETDIEDELDTESNNPDESTGSDSSQGFDVSKKAKKSSHRRRTQRRQHR